VQSRHVVLAVDDDTVLLELLRLVFLLDDRIAVIPAADGGEAIRIVEADGADVMVLDLMMPSVDGYQVLAQVGHKIPTVVLTAKYDVDDTVDRCLRLGARKVMGKPFHPDELLDTVLALLPAEG
jgi:DNA-binding response OmpR family regulator